MHIAKGDVPVKIDVPGAVARQALDFGDASGYGSIAGEYFSLGEGTDIAPLLKGLKGDAYQAPHWGYVISARSWCRTPTDPTSAVPEAISSTGLQATASASTATPRSSSSAHTRNTSR